MKYLLIVGVLALAGCAGPEGNPDGQPYATDPGGTIAVAPAVNGVVAYDPESQAPQSADTATVNGLPPVTKTPMPAPSPRQ